MMSSGSRILFTKGAGQRTEAEVMQHAMYQYTLLQSTEARLHAVHPITKDFIRKELSENERFDLLCSIVALEASQDAEPDVSIALQISKANILAVNAELKSAATSGFSATADLSDTTAAVNEHRRVWSMDSHGGVPPPTATPELPNYVAPTCHTAVDGDEEDARSDGILTPTMMSPRLTRPFSWTDSMEEYSIAAETEQPAFGGDTGLLELENPWISVALEREATPATPLSPVPAASALRNRAPRSSDPKASVDTAEDQGLRSRTPRPCSQSQVPEESTIHAETVAVPPRASRAYTVSGASLVNSGAKEVGENREARQQQEKRRQEQANQTMAEKLQQEEQVRLENERRRQEERRHMNIQRQHQIADQGRQERVDAGLAQPSQNDERYLRGAEDYRYHRRLTDDFYRAGDEAYDRRPRGAIYLSDLDLDYNRRPEGAFSLADLQAAYNRHPAGSTFTFADLQAAYIEHPRRYRAELQAAYNEHPKRGYYPDDLNGAYNRRLRRH